MMKRFGTCLRLGACVMLALLLPGCAAHKGGPFVIGIVNNVVENEEILAGFKEGLSAQGYAEGTRISFIYDKPVGNDEAKVDAEIMRVMEAKPDAVLALGGMSIKAAGRLLKGKKIPVLLAPVTDSYLKTLVQSYRRPGGNMTGVRAVLDSAKMVEWIRKVTPGAKTVFVPYTVSANDLKALTTATVGMTVVTPMLGSAEEAGAAVSRLSRGTVILVYPTNLGIAGFSPLATRMRIPVFSFMPSQIDEGALFTLHLDHAKIGKQTARMMGMIINGTSPVEIPVETAEFSVTISYKVAQSLGLELSDDLLVQADRIIR